MNRAGFARSLRALFTLALSSAFRDIAVSGAGDITALTILNAATVHIAGFADDAAAIYEAAVNEAYEAGIRHAAVTHALALTAAYEVGASGVVDEMRTSTAANDAATESS